MINNQYHLVAIMLVAQDAQEKHQVSGRGFSEVEAIKAEIPKLKAINATKPSRASTTKPKAGKRTMSAEARARISAAQAARWAKVKGKSKKAVPKAAAPAKRAKLGKAGKRTMSPEVREKIAAAQRKRWAKTKR